MCLVLCWLSLRFRCLIIWCGWMMCIIWWFWRGCWRKNWMCCLSWWIFCLNWCSRWWFMMMVIFIWVWWWRVWCLKWCLFIVRKWLGNLVVLNMWSCLLIVCMCSCLMCRWWLLCFRNGIVRLGCKNWNDVWIGGCCGVCVDGVCVMKYSFEWLWFDGVCCSFINMEGV